MAVIKFDAALGHLTLELRCTLKHLNYFVILYRVH